MTEKTGKPLWLKIGCSVIVVVILIFGIIFFCGFMSSNKTLLEYVKTFPEGVRTVELKDNNDTNETVSTPINETEEEGENTEGTNETTATSTTSTTTTTTTTTTYAWYLDGGVVHYTDTGEPVECSEEIPCPEEIVCNEAGFCVI